MDTAMAWTARQPAGGRGSGGQTAAGWIIRPVPMVLAALAVLALAGCKTQPQFYSDATVPYQDTSLAIEEPDVQPPNHPSVRDLPAPHSIHGDEPHAYWDLTLEQAIRIALSDAEVLRDIGVRVISGPTNAVPTIYDPAHRESDVRGGPEAALAAFDAQFSMGLFFEHNQHAFNNFFFGGGNNLLNEGNALFQAEISKQTALGTQFALRNKTQYNRNNAAFNLFPSVYDTSFELEAIHPLLQGAGVEFNRIAGPNAQPGMYNGVLIGRINTDISLADFEAGVTNLLGDVERTYWDLYFAYRNLDAAKEARDAALKTWRTVQRKFDEGSADGEQEANARAQYYLFQSQVIDALSGVQIAAPGASVPAGGVYATERRLRSLLGLPPNDARLIRPADEPQIAEAVFNWDEALQDALWRRVELRRQKWLVKRLELELIAARNFTKMRLDLVGRYRKPGFGDNLVGDYGYAYDSAFDNLFNGNRNEWTLGLQLSTPIGNRIGHTAVRNAELALSRERAIYREQELQIAHDLSNAFGEVDRAHATMHSNLNRKIATHQQLEAIRRKYDGGLIPLEFLLTAQQQTAQANTAYYRSLVDYNIAIARLCKSRGALLDFYQVYLTEGPASEDALRSAAKQARRFKLYDYRLTVPPDVSLGLYPQHTTDAEQVEAMPGGVVPPHAIPGIDGLPGMPLEPGAAPEPPNAQEPPEPDEPDELKPAPSRSKLNPFRDDSGKT